MKGLFKIPRIAPEHAAVLFEPTTPGMRSYTAVVRITGRGIAERLAEVDVRAETDESGVRARVVASNAYFGYRTDEILRVEERV